MEFEIENDFGTQQVSITPGQGLTITGQNENGQPQTLNWSKAQLWASWAQYVLDYGVYGQEMAETLSLLRGNSQITEWNQAFMDYLWGFTLGLCRQ